MADPRSEHHGDDDLRALLGDAVSDVEPPPALERIQARTKVTPMNSKRPWIYAAVGAVAATAATIVVVTVVSDDGTNTTAGPVTSPTPTATATSPTEPPSESPTGSGEPTDEPSATAGPTTAVPVYYVGDTNAGPRLYREFHRLPEAGAAADQVEIALSEAVADSAIDPDYRSGWPPGTTIAGVTVAPAAEDRMVTIDLTNDSVNLHDRPDGISRGQAQMAVQQLVYTAHAVLQQRPPVQLLLDGERTDTVLGVPTSEPLAAADPMQVQATVWITSPRDGAVVSAPVEVEGRGAFFEANVSWQLLQNGQVVEEGFTMAEEGMTLSPYSFRVDAPPGHYVLRVYDADMSGGEGNGEAQDTKRITIR